MPSPRPPSPAAPAPPAARRRTIRKAAPLIVLLIAGATLNVAVAWGRVLVKGSITYSTRYFHDPDWGSKVVAIHQSRGYNVVWPSGHPLYYSPDWIHTFQGRVWWDDESLGPINTGNFAIACGWPMFSLTSWRTARDRDVFSSPGVIQWGIALPSPPSHPNIVWVPPILALKPLWPGFAINTVFYAGVLWVLFCGPFALRRMIRRRRGQCPQCGYPIGQSPVCTECGAAVTLATPRSCRCLRW